MNERFWEDYQDCGPGGLKSTCQCCGADARHKDHGKGCKAYHQIARAKKKARAKKEIQEALNER